MERSHLLARCTPRAVRRSGSEACVLPEKSRRKRLLAVAYGTRATLGEHAEALQTDHVVAGQLLQTREFRLRTARRLAAGRPLYARVSKLHNNSFNLWSVRIYSDVILLKKKQSLATALI